jgi:hypothetical protein
MDDFFAKKLVYYYYYWEVWRGRLTCERGGMAGQQPVPSTIYNEIGVRLWTWANPPPPPPHHFL